MIQTEIIVALIGAAGSVLTTAIVVYFQNKRLHEKTTAEAASNMQLVGYKIDKLTEEQKKYNNLQERMVKLEVGFEALDEKQTQANVRIDKLENKERIYGKRAKG